MHSTLDRLLLIAALLLLSGFFSGSEVALFSMSRARRQALAAASDATSRLILKLLGKPRRLIATILVGNEFVNISIGAVSATLGERAFAGMGVLWAEILTTAIVLPVILLIGEVTPKSIALKLSVVWARAAARPIALFAWIATPVRWLVRGISEALLFLLGARPPARDAGLKEEEFRALVDVGSAEGELEATERRLIHNVFDFGDTSVMQVMTPASEVFALPRDLPMARIVEEVTKRRFSRVPVYQGKPDNIVGVLLAKDLVGYARGQWSQDQTLGDLLRPPFYVPKTTKLDRLFRQMQRRKTHMALVVDEYGRTIGIVTMEDLLLQLFGKLSDERVVRVPQPFVETGERMAPADQTPPVEAKGELPEGDTLR